MRKLTFFLIAFSVMMASCTEEEPLKDDITKELTHEDQTEYTTDAEIVEGIMTKSLSQLDAITLGESKTLEIVEYLLTDLIPQYGISTIIEPLWEQVKDCYVNDTLTVGLNNLSGQFTATVNRWMYREADCLQFCFPWKNEEQVEYTILCGEKLTESPIFHFENVFITLPEKIRTTTEVDGTKIGQSDVTSAFKCQHGVATGNFKVKGNLLDSLSSSGELSFSIVDRKINSCEYEYTVIDKDGNTPVAIGYKKGLTGVDYITITMDGRLRFEIDVCSLVQMAGIVVLGNTMITEDSTPTTIAYVKAMVDKFNKESDIHFFLDDVLTGQVTLEVLEDNEAYAVDMVMAYVKDGSLYEVHGIYSGIYSLIQRASSLISIIKDLFEYLTE